MLADLDTALRSPWDLIQSIYEQQSGQDALSSIEGRVAEVFAELFENQAALEQLPRLTSTTTPSSLPPAGSLVRFRGMVQDTGVGSELFRCVGGDKQLYMYGREMAPATSDGPAKDTDYGLLKERQSFYVVTVPGETAWAQELDRKTGEALPAIGSLSVSEREQTTTAITSNRHPIPSEPHFGCIVKTYGEVGDSLKITDVLEFVGVVADTTISSSFDELADPDADTPVQTVPALHAILVLPPSTPKPSPLSGPSRLRADLVQYLAQSLAGDLEAAEWLLLALLARIHTRHPTGMALGSMSLNLAVPNGSAIDLTPVLASLVPTLSAIDLSIPILNSHQTRMAPRSRDEVLDSGALQLTKGTTVLVDMRGIGEGKLEDAGVKNLRHLATTMAQQKLSYEFPYSSFELETDLNFVVVSEGKAIIPADCIVYVKPTAENTAPAAPSAEQLNAFRHFLASMKASEFAIPDSMSEIIQADFVERRQKSVAAEGMTQEDLLFRMTAARLLALSRGEASLSKEVWLRTAELDESRKERAPVAAKNAA